MDGRILDPNIVGIEDAGGKASAEAWEIPFSALCAQLEPEMVKRELMLPAPDTKLRLYPSVAYGFADPRTREDPSRVLLRNLQLAGLVPVLIVAKARSLLPPSPPARAPTHCPLPA